MTKEIVRSRLESWRFNLNEVMELLDVLQNDQDSDNGQGDVEMQVSDQGSSPEPTENQGEPKLEPKPEPKPEIDPGSQPSQSSNRSQLKLIEPKDSSRSSKSPEPQPSQSSKSVRGKKIVKPNEKIYDGSTESLSDEEPKPSHSMSRSGSSAVKRSAKRKRLNSRTSLSPFKKIKYRNMVKVNFDSMI